MCLVSELLTGSDFYGPRTTGVCQQMAVFPQKKSFAFLLHFCLASHAYQVGGRRCISDNAAFEEMCSRFDWGYRTIRGGELWVGNMNKVGRHWRNVLLIWKAKETAVKDYQIVKMLLKSSFLFLKKA